jgi:hypothetical protein
MSAVVQARVAEQLTRLRHVAERLDAVLMRRRAPNRRISILDSVPRQEVDPK